MQSAHRTICFIYSAFFLTFSFASSALAQTPNFAPVVEYLMGQDSQEFTVGDFNSDGNLDVITASFYDNALYFRLGNGDGTFQAETSLVDAGSPNDVKSADLNGDGKLDLISTRVADNVAVVRFGNGDGTFQSEVTYAVGNAPYFLALADLNANSVLDLVVSNISTNNISVLLGNGDGTFGAATNYSAPAGVASVRIVQPDNSGVADIAVVGSSSNLLSILPGNGDGTFGASADYVTGANPFNLAKGDLNRDGFDDIVVPNTSTNTFDLFLAAGDGSYNSRTSIVAGNGANAAAIADLNSDGFADVVISNTDDNQIQIFAGNGNGALTSAALLNTGPIPESVYIQPVDLNKDGLLDLVVSKWGTPGIHGAFDVYLNTTPAAEIDILGNYVSIPSGSDIPSTANGTDFGGAAVNSGTVDKTYELLNTGAYNLTLNGSPKVEISGANAGDFSAVTQPNSPVDTVTASTFQIRFAPTASGARTATVTIRNTDPDEATYTFAIQGNGVIPPTTKITHKPAKTSSVDSGKSKKRVRFNFSSTTSGATFLCKHNNGAFSSCSSPTRYSLKPGQHTFKVKAVIDGVADQSPSVYRFEIKR